MVMKSFRAKNGWCRQLWVEELHQGNIIYKWKIFQQATFDYQRVQEIHGEKPWSYMGFIWSYMVLYAFIWFYMVLYGLYGFIWFYMILSEMVKHSPTFYSKHPWFPVSQGPPRWSKMFGPAAAWCDRSLWLDVSWTTRFLLGDLGDLTHQCPMNAP